jgi:HTH-type transcriptional regulator/antitoxin HigA
VKKKSLAMARKKYPVLMNNLASALYSQCKEAGAFDDPQKFKAITKEVLGYHLGTIIDIQSETLLSPGYVIEMEISARKLQKKDVASGLGIKPSNLSELLKGERTVTPDMALKLEIYFGIDATFWLHVQNHYTLALKNRQSPAT